ncbi:MAG: SMC family ATPase [Acidimicrobiales bacterium]|nr:SMC family ATPase [Acidimicrobiales bacterium]MCB9372267.1 SMC family ATPase [Microthrixaceae bacterium]
MRPLELEVEGFTAFRDRTTVDFRGADLFALSGPTGAGKSSVIDALTFALYGSVARYGDRRLVAPLVSQGKVEARVRLDFALGAEAYRVARVVRMTGRGGATTKEARLERLDGVGPDAGSVENLAGDADGVTAAVAGLLGLSFEHFNTCVVLPQGEFARFLHEKPAERQDLLVELLGLGVYEQMRALANQRARAAAVERDLLDRRLADLAHATVDARKALAGRVKLLANLVDKIEEAQPELDRLAGDAEAARSEAAGLTDQAGRLAGLAVPADVAEMGTKLASVRDEVDRRRTEADLAAAVLAEAEAAHDPDVDRTALELAVRDLEEREAVAARLLRGEARQVEARTAAGEAREAVDATAAALRAAEEALEAARRDDLAGALVATLTVGEPCPVCRQPVGHLPEHDALGVADATAARARAAEDASAAQLRLTEAQRALDKIEVTLAGVREQLADLDARVDGQPPLAAARARLEALVRAEQDLVNARAADREARANLDRLTTSQDRLAEREREQRRDFDRRRDELAALGPPPAQGDRLADDWTALVAWADEQRPALDEQAAAAAARAVAADEQRVEVVTRIEDFCRSVDLELEGRAPLTVAVEERTRAEGQLATLDDELARRSQLDAERGTADRAEALARTLAQHLKADRFEHWILDEAHDRLLDGATRQLGALAGGSYSLAVDDKRQFTVVDHANADTVRLARTLSGGETFLVSLALALALADQIAELAAGGAVRLESLFLDEGFGSLDADTLETVATALEELGAQGRVVGVVTHVRELAERLPVRYEVRKGPAGSAIERVED